MISIKNEIINILNKYYNCSFNIDDYTVPELIDFIKQNNKHQYINNISIQLLNLICEKYLLCNANIIINFLEEINKNHTIITNIIDTFLEIQSKELDDCNYKYWWYNFSKKYCIENKIEFVEIEKYENNLDTKKELLKNESNYRFNFS